MSPYPENVIAEINSRIDIARLMKLIDYRSDKIQDSGETLKGFCPIHRESVFRTLIIDKSQHTFRCMYGLCDGSEGGNLIQLFSLARRIPFDEAANILVHELGIQVSLPIDPEFVERHVEVAENYLELGELADAEKIFRELVHLKPDLYRAHESLLQIYQQTGDRQGEARSREALAQHAINEGRFEEALTHSRVLTEIRPDDPAAHRLLGECYRKTGDNDSALGEFMAEADLCEARSNLEDAIKAYVKAEELGLDLVDVNPHILRAYLQLGRKQQAIEHVVAKAERAAQQTDYGRAAELYFSILELDDGRLDLRSRFIEIASLAEPAPELLDRIFATIHLLIARQEPRRAGQALDRVLENSPENHEVLVRVLDLHHTMGNQAKVAELQVRLAQLLHKEGKTEDALHQLNQLLSEQPEHPGALETLAAMEGARGNITLENAALRKLANVLGEKHDYARAVKVLDQILSTEPDALDVQEKRAQTLEAWGRAGEASALEQAAHAFENLGRFYDHATAGRRATEYLERAASLTAPRPDLLFQLARSYIRTGAKAQARDMVVRASEMQANQGELNDAIQNAEQFVSLLPEEPALAKHLADLYARSGDTENAGLKLRDLAANLASRGNTREAGEALEQAIGILPEDVKSMQDLAELYYSQDDNAKYTRTVLRIVEIHEQNDEIDDAIRTLEDLVANRPNEIPAIQKLLELTDKAGRKADARRWRLRITDLARESGDSGEQLRLLEEALEHDPDDEEVLKYLITCRFARNETEQACAVARKLSSLQRGLGRESDARTTLARALEQAPDDLETNEVLFRALTDAGLRQEAVSRGLHLTDIYVNLGRTEDAAQTYEKLVECDSENLTLKLNQVEFLRRIERGDLAADKLHDLAKLYEFRGNFEEAERILLEALEIDQESICIREELVGIYVQQGKIEEADEKLTQVAELYRTQGVFEKAVTSVRQLLSRNPGNSVARRQLVRYLQELNQTEEAVLELHQLADLCRRQGREHEALEAEREASVLAPDSAPVHRRFIESLTRLGENAKAAAELEQFAIRQIQMEQLPKALQTLNELLSISPDNVNARRMRAELYADMGDERRALEEFRALSSSLVSSGIVGGDPSTRQDAPVMHPQLQLVREYDFDHFVVGANNNFAYATALAVARAPARAYNPLFIYSDVGLGKTHLANAIANHVAAHDPKSRIIYTNSEDFTGELVEAIQSNTINQFRTRYKTVDLLIVDDVQFLAGKERAQEEFFHIFNALFQAKKQIVITSDRPPKNIAHLENRLLSRFGAGVIVDIASPDLETRIAILMRDIKDANLELDSAIPKMIAERIDTNVRELKGALNQVIATIRIRNEEITEEGVRRMLETLYVRA